MVNRLSIVKLRKVLKARKAQYLRVVCMDCRQVRAISCFRNADDLRVCVTCEWLNKTRTTPNITNTKSILECGNKIENAMLKIAHSKDNYFLVDKILSPKMCEAVKRSAEFQRTEPINFDGEQRRTQTTVLRNWDTEGQQLIREKIMNDFLSAHPATTYFTAKILESLPGCQQQPFHSDDLEYTSSMVPRSFDDAPFSLIVALEENNNPTRVIFPTGSVLLEQGDMLIMKGDCFHAGAAYKQRNQRLFIATGTREFPHNGEYVNLLRRTGDLCNHQDEDPSRPVRISPRVYN